MTEKRWAWWYSFDQERYDGPHASRDDALAYAREEAQNNPDPERTEIYIEEATKPGIEAICIDGERVIDYLDNTHEDMLDPDGDGRLFDATPPQAADLGKRLTETIVKWAADHGLKPRFWYFDDSRNEEIVKLR